MSKFDKGVIWRIISAIVSAVLLWSSFASHGEAVNVFIALVPMLIVARTSSVRVSAKYWALFGLLFWVLALSWMPAIIKNNGPWPLVLLGWGALALYCTFYMTAFGAVSAMMWRGLEGDGFRRWLRPLVLAVVEPALWTGLELMRANIGGGFAWGFLGVPFASFRLGVGCAAIGGIYALSWVVFLANGLIATVLIRVLAPILFGRVQTRRDVASRILMLLETAVPFVVMLAFMVMPQVPVVRKAGSIPVRVALVQRNFPCIFSGSERENPYEAYAPLLAKASLLRPDLTVFSESAMAEFEGRGNVEHPGSLKAVARLASAANLGGFILAGGDFIEQDGQDMRVYNAAALYDCKVPDALPQVYCKQHLVPFGEFIPLDKTITCLQKLSPIGVSLHAGKPKLLDLRIGENKVKLAPLICFEDLDSCLVRRAAKDGAQLIAVITNDSWFSNSAEARLHFLMAKIRATETGLPMVRTGNSGVTAIVRPGGSVRILGRDEGEPLVDDCGILAETVYVPGEPVLTRYTRLGDIPLVVVFLLAVLFAAALGGLFDFGIIKRIKTTLNPV